VALNEGQQLKSPASDPGQRGGGPGTGRFLRLGLAPKMVVAIVLVAVVTGGLIGLILTNTSRNELRRNILNYNLAHADLAAQFSSNYVKAIQGNIRSFASRPTVRRAVLTGRPDAVQAELAEFLQTQPALDSVNIYDARGIARVSGVLTAQNIGKSHIDREWFQQTMAGRKPYLGLATKSRVTGRPTIPYTVPILDGKGEVAGILTGGISLAILSGSIISIVTAPDARAALNDMRQGGIILAHKDAERILTPVSGRNEAHHLMATGKRGMIETPSSTGEMSLVAYTPVPDLPWGILIIQPSATALAPINTLTMQAVLIIIFSIIATAIGGALLARKITRPLLALRETAGQIAGGDLTRRVEVLQEDEIGALGRAFNKMAAALSEREAALAAAEKAKTAAEMIEGMLDPVVITDPEGRIMQMNKAFQKTYGYGAEMIGELPTRLVTPADVPGVISSIRQGLAEGQVNNFACNCISRDGRTFPVLVNIKSLQNEDGTPRGLVASVRDITEIRKVEEELLQSQVFTEAILNSVPGILYLYDEQGTLVQWNQTFTEVTGYSDEELRHKTISDWFDDEEKELVAAAARRVLEKGRSTVEAKLVVKDGRRIPYYFTGVPVKIGGRPYLIGVGIDMTERIQAEEAKRVAEENLRAAYLELERSNADLEKFAYVASHDLQEPLRMVVSYMELIERRYRELLDEDGRTFMHFAVDGAVRMQDLINGLLAYSRVGGTRARLFKPTNIADAVTQAAENLKIIIDENQAEIVCEDSLPVVMADPSQMIQLFQNLIANAVKFRALEPPRVWIGVRLSDGCWQFSVRDNGIGIDSRYHGRIFNIFQRLQRREDYHGTGTGLAIARKIVERHGGRIWVESQPGAGAIFYFTIPSTGGITDEKRQNNETD